MQKKQKRFFLGLIILIILIVLFTYYSELKTKNSNSDNLPLSPGSKNSRIQEDDSTNSKNLFEINPELTIEFVGPERLATLHISPKSAIDACLIISVFPVPVSPESKTFFPSAQ